MNRTSHDTVSGAHYHRKREKSKRPAPPTDLAKVNWDLLRRTADSIEAGKIGFDMTEWLIDTPAGPAADVAGHVVAVADPDYFLAVLADAPAPLSIRARAASALHLSDDQLAREFLNPRSLLLSINRNRQRVPAALRW